MPKTKKTTKRKTTKTANKKAVKTKNTKKILLTIGLIACIVGILLLNG